MDPRAENAHASAPSARKREALELFAGLPRRYDLLSAALSFGQDPRWRRALVDALAPQPGDRVLDVATGTGLVARELLERCDCSVVGVDQSAAMLARARTRAAWRLYTAVGLPLLGRLASREWARVGRFLGPSIRGFYEQHPLERIVEYWLAAGLVDVEVRRMSLGGGVLMWARKGGDR